MTIGTEWIIKIKTTEGISGEFIEGAVIDGIGMDNTGKDIVSNINVTCLKEFTRKEYEELEKEFEDAITNMENEFRNIPGIQDVEITEKHQ